MMGDKRVSREGRLPRYIDCKEVVQHEFDGEGLFLAWFWSVRSHPLLKRHRYDLFLLLPLTRLIIIIVPVVVVVLGCGVHRLSPFFFLFGVDGGNVEISKLFFPFDDLHPAPVLH